MPTRTFTVAELAEHEVPPDRPEDVQFSQTVLLDEHVANLKYSQQRRAIFRADDDGKTYSVTYEANVDAAGYEIGPGPDNHGWFGDSVEATEVLQRAVIASRWEPVIAVPGPEQPKVSAIDSLTALVEENGATTAAAREAAAAWIVEHADEVADLYDAYLADADGEL